MGRRIFYLQESMRQFEWRGVHPPKCDCCLISPAGGAVTLHIGEGLPSTLGPEKKACLKFLILWSLALAKPYIIMDIYNNTCDIKPIHYAIQHIPPRPSGNSVHVFNFWKTKQNLFTRQSTCSWLHRTRNK